MNLELFAIRWLRWEKRCQLVLRERSPRAYSCGQPDVLGVMASRHLIEIEIKRSVSDFRADGLKLSRSDRKPDNPNLERLLKKLPKQFYYLIPAELQARIEPEVPLWAGLMIGPTAHNYCLTVVKKAPNNASSQRLTIKECCHLVHMISNWAITEAERHHNAYRKFTEGHWEYPEPEFEI